MPIRVDYTPTTDLLNLARAAGAGEGAVRSQATDLAFTQMVLGTQGRYAEMGLASQARDRAFSLQEAAAARAARTPIARRAIRSPLADQVLGRMQYKTALGEEQQTTQLDQLDQLRDEGTIDDATYERAKLGVLGGNDALVRQALQVPKKAKPTISAAQELRIVRDQYRRQRTPLVKERDEAMAWLVAPSGVTDEQRDKFRDRLDTITKSLAKIDQEETDAFDQFRRGELLDPLGQRTGATNQYEGLVATGPNGERVVFRSGQWVPE